MKIKPIFRWYDMWVGFYYDRENKTLYFFPIPMLGLKIEFKKKKHFEDEDAEYLRDMQPILDELEKLGLRIPKKKEKNICLSVANTLLKTKNIGILPSIEDLADVQPITEEMKKLGYPMDDIWEGKFDIATGKYKEKK